MGDGQRPRAWIVKVLLLGSGPLAALVFWSTGFWPGVVERLYAEAFYPALGRVLAVLGALIPLAWGELLLLAVLAVGLAGLGLAGLRVARSRREGLRSCWRGAQWAAAGVSGLYAAFVLAWGLNYRRPPLAELLRWPVAAPRVEELRGLCAELVPQVNAWRAKAVFDADLPRVAAQAAEGYRRLGAGLAPAVRDVATTPVKPALLSAPMSWSLTYGMVIPWTHEGLINRDTPAPAVPFTLCHEMAHQRGIAREDEANFVGYAAARLHPDASFRYSALRFALAESLGQLARVDPETAAALVRELDPAVREDYQAESAWAHRRRSGFSRVQARVYDGYLKSQGQKEGLRSYGRVVDLLIAERRLRLANSLPAALR